MVDGVVVAVVVEAEVVVVVVVVAVEAARVDEAAVIVVTERKITRLAFLLSLPLARNSCASGGGSWFAFSNILHLGLFTCNDMHENCDYNSL